MGVLPPLLKSVRERGGELPRRAQDAKQTPARVDMATIRKAMRRGRWRMGNLLLGRRVQSTSPLPRKRQQRERVETSDIGQSRAKVKVMM
jgi:hypothetical protein